MVTRMKEKLSIFCFCKSGYSNGLWGFDSIFVLDLTPKSKFWHHRTKFFQLSFFERRSFTARAKFTASATDYYIWYILWIFIYLFKVKIDMYFVIVIKFSSFSFTWFYQNYIQDNTSFPSQPQFGLHVFCFLYGTLRPSYLILDRKSRVFIRAITKYVNLFFCIFLSSLQR